MLFNRLFAFGFLQRLGGKHTRKMPCKKSLAFGFILFSASVCLYIFWCELLDLIINWQMQLKEGKAVFSAWRNLPIPLQIKVHVFQITNGRDFQEGKAWPEVTEVGPFVMIEYRKREIHSWSDHNGAVKFSENLEFEFDASQSVAPLTAPVNVINMPLLLTLGFVESTVTQFHLSMFSPAVDNLVMMLFQMFDEKLIEERTVEEVLNGGEVEILKLVETLTTSLRSLGIALPDIGVGMYTLTESKFGFIRIRQNRSFGPAEVYTGKSKGGRFNHFRSVEDRTSLSFYRDARCNEIKGTEGTFFGPHPPAWPNATLYIFKQHVCRPMKFIFEKESSVQLINTLRYRMDHRQFSILSQPENWCFCPKEETITRCEGVLYMRQCLSGVPMVLSYPHFLTAPRMMAKVRGLNPDPEKHLGYIEVERTLGINMAASIGLQFNVDLKPYNAVSSLSQFRPVIMPWLRIDEETAIQGSFKYLMIVISNVIVFAEEGFILSGAMGALMMFKSLTVLAIRKMQEIKQRTKVMAEESADTEKVSPPDNSEEKVSQSEK